MGTLRRRAGYDFDYKASGYFPMVGRPCPGLETSLHRRDDAGPIAPSTVAVALPNRGVSFVSRKGSFCTHHPIAWLLFHHLPIDACTGSNACYSKCLEVIFFVADPLVYGPSGPHGP